MFDSLGSTHDEIARNLRALAILGTPNTVRVLNPIVKYVMMNFKKDALMLDVIKGDRLTITYADWKKEEVPFPPAVIEFLQRFNRREYPDLILPHDPSAGSGEHPPGKV